MISSGFTQPGPVRYHTHISPHTPQSGHGGENTQHRPTSQKNTQENTTASPPLFSGAVYSMPSFISLTCTRTAHSKIKQTE